MQELLHIQLRYDAVGGWPEALDEIIDLIVVRSWRKTLLHHPNVHRLAKLKLGSSKHRGSCLTNGFEHHIYLVFSRLGSFLQGHDKYGMRGHQVTTRHVGVQPRCTQRCSDLVVMLQQLTIFFIV